MKPSLRWPPHLRPAPHAARRFLHVRLRAIDVQGMTGPGREPAPSASPFAATLLPKESPRPASQRTFSAHLTPDSLHNSVFCAPWPHRRHFAVWRSTPPRYSPQFPPATTPRYPAPWAHTPAQILPLDSLHSPAPYTPPAPYAYSRSFPRTALPFAPPRPAHAYLPCARASR